MQCDVCSRTEGHKLPFLCPTDARNELYEPRLDYAQLLLKKDILDRQVTALTSSSSNTNPIDAYRDPSSRDEAARWDIERNNAERDRLFDRAQQIISRADQLRIEVENARKDISRREASLDRRKSELASAALGVDGQRAKRIADVERTTRVTNYKWNRVHNTTAESRAVLCAEAAKLYGLRRLQENDVWLDEYSIAGIPIIDLRAMNNASPAQITTSLSHLAHLLVLSTHYLSLRLPAEVTLPHRDYPLPTILSLTASYKFSNIPFPGSMSVQPSGTSPSISQPAEPVNLPRPRPLFIDKPLPLLQKEDPATYSAFLEGATLLAYNIAWVCKTQGVPVGKSKPTSFEDICAIGRNLFNLLIGTSHPSPTSRNPSNASTPIGTAVSTPTKAKAKIRDLGDADDSGVDEGRKAKRDPNSAVGRFSHGTAHHSLVSREGNDLIRGIKHMPPKALAATLRNVLLSEVTNAEWEVLDHESWADEDGKEFEDEGVMVGATRDSSDRPGRLAGGSLGRFGDAMQSFMSMGTVMDAIEIISSSDGTKDKKPGTSGWTKIKPR